MESLPATRLPLKWEDKLAYLAYELRCRGGTVGWPVEHELVDGWYVRTIRLPPGVVLIGRKHREGHICKLISGRLIHIVEGKSRVVEAPFTMVTYPGYQMVLHTLTDCVGQTYHPRLDTDIDVEAMELQAFEPEDEVLRIGKAIAERNLVEAA